jgi:hypothetical protein
MNLLIKGDPATAIHAASDHDFEDVRFVRTLNNTSIVSAEAADAETRAAKWMGEHSSIPEGYGFLPGTLLFYWKSES